MTRSDAWKGGGATAPQRLRSFDETRFDLRNTAGRSHAHGWAHDSADGGRSRSRSIPAGVLVQTTVRIEESQAVEAHRRPGPGAVVLSTAGFTSEHFRRRMHACLLRLPHGRVMWSSVPAPVSAGRSHASLRNRGITVVLLSRDVGHLGVTASDLGLANDIARCMVTLDLANPDWDTAERAALSIDRPRAIEELCYVLRRSGRARTSPKILGSHSRFNMIGALAARHWRITLALVDRNHVHPMPTVAYISARALFWEPSARSRASPYARCGTRTQTHHRVP